MKTVKTSTKQFGSWPLIFALSAITASASIQVTYNVDLSVQEQLGNFKPNSGDTVFVAGNFATSDGTTWLQTATDGSTNYILSLVPGTTNYTGTFTITNDVGTFEDHQFVINPGGNYASTLIWEPNVIGGPNRYFQVPSVNTNLPVVYFNDVSNANQLVAVPVTFSVNMSVQSTMGIFHEGLDLVEVSGDFNGFTAASGTVLMDNGNNIYTNTCIVTNTIGATENYKFIILPYSGNPSSIWEVDGLGPNGANNRQFILPSVATNTGIAYFNNTTNPPNYAAVTFNVNMAVQDAKGTFTPGSDSISVAGNPLNNWTTGIFILTNSLANPDLYVGTFNVTNVGSTTSFKYVDSNSGAMGNGGWESSANRTVLVPASGTNLPVVYWNNAANLGNLSLSNGAGTATLKWTAGTNIRLQSSTNLASGWQNVPNTQGSNSLSTNIIGQHFFRLNGP